MMRVKGWVVPAVAAGVLSLCAADAGFGALAGRTAGLSGTLSSNRAIRKQQLIADPATPSPTELGAPRRGSTSINYDASMVTLSDIEMGTGYRGAAFVEVDTGEGIILQDSIDFLLEPAGTETGFAQVFFHHGLIPKGVEFPRDRLIGPPGEPSQVPVAPGYRTFDQDGPVGFDTHSFFFDYKDGVPETRVAEYDIFADTGTHGNDADFIVGRQNGREFTLGPGDLSSATVRASLVPLPPAAWAGLVTLAGVGVLVVSKRRLATALVR